VRFLLLFIVCLFFWQLPVQAGLRIGIILPLSGKEAQRGEAIRAFLLELNQRFYLRHGLHFDLRFYDSKAKPSRVSKLVKEAFFDGVGAIIGPFNPAGASHLYQAAQKFKIPVVITTGEINPIKYLREPIGPVFRTGLSSRMAVKVIYRCLQRQGFHRIGLLLTNDAFGREGERWLTAYATEYAIKIVAKRYFGTHDTDVTVHLRALLSCEAVVCWAPPRSSAIVARNLSQEALNLPVFFSHQVAWEGFLRREAGLYGRPFVGAAFLAGDAAPIDPQISVLYQAFRQRFDFLRDPVLAAFADAFLFVKIGALRAGYAYWSRGLEQAGLVRGLTGLYFLSKDDHYGLLPGSVGVFRYRWSGYDPVCPPRAGVL